MRPQDADSARWRRWIISAHCGDGDKWQVLFEARSGERMADKMTTWKTTYISASVHQAGDNPIINEQSTTVTICDEAGGAFISLTDSEGTTIKLDPDEFEIVANVARWMLECFDDKMQKSLNAVEESNVEPRIAEDGGLHMSMRDLLAVIHRDNGSHTGMVGLHQSCKDAESVVLKLRGDGAQSKSSGWTSTKPTNGGIYWVQLDRGLAAQPVEVYRLDEDYIWRARVVIIGSAVASFHVNSLTKALWYGPLSAPPLT